MDINLIKSEIIGMAKKVYEMLESIERGFMENRAEILAGAMKKEHEINDMEKLLTQNILDLSKNSNNNNRKDLVALAQVIEMLERMGDEATCLIERIEIKIAESLLFSDLGVEQFNETYGSMKKSVELMIEFLKGKDSGLRERIIANGFHVKELVERYRREHADRLVQGLCSPMGANMYFDMLDFTGNLARHSSNIVKLF